MAMPSLSKINWNTPALVPPAGVKSNYVDPSGYGDAIVIVNAVFVALMMIAYIIRVYSKGIISRQKIDWSDVTCFLAVLGSIAYTVLSIYNTQQGVGRHMWDIRLLSLTSEKTRLFSMVEVIYVITIYFVKISFLLQFWQFFRFDKLSRRLIIGGLVGFTVVTVPYLIVAAIHVSECDGLRALTTTICHQKEISITNLTFGTLNVMTDFYVLAVPIVQLKTLHVSTRKKFGVMAIFLAGFVASMMSVVRLGFIARNVNSKDVLHTSAFMEILACVEMKLAIICGCVVHMPAGFKQGRLFIRGAYTSFSRFRGTRSNVSTPSEAKSEDHSMKKLSAEKVHVQSSEQLAYDELKLPESQREPEALP